MIAWTCALAAGALVFYTDDYVIAGVLPELAAELGVPTAAAGQLVTVFSAVVAVTAPIAAVAFARVPRRSLLTTAALVFALANLLAAQTPSFTALLALRVLAALAAASATPALFSTAAQLAPPERVGRSVAVVAFGVTGSIALGVPVGTWLGGALGWRATFATMAAAGVLVAAGFAAALPKRTGSAEVLPVREQLAVLARPAISLGLGGNLALMLGSMMMLTYLGPVTAELTGAGFGLRGALFALSGLGGMAGLWLGGAAADRWGPDRALRAGVLAFVAAMAALLALWPLRPVPGWALVPIGVVWTGAAFWTSPAVQARLHVLAGPVSGQALALNTSGTYLGVAAGGAVGGAVIGAAGLAPLPAVAAVAGLGAAALFRLAAAPGKQPV